MARMPAALSSLCLIAATALAQNPPTPADPLAGRVALGFLSTSGNTDSTNTNAAFGLVFAPDARSHQVDLSAVTATTSEVTTAEAYAAKYQFRRVLGPRRRYLFAGIDWKEDRFSAYEQQVTESVGYGRRVLDNERHMLNLEIGTGARQAVLIDGAEQDEGILRGALSYNWVLTEQTGFRQEFVVESGASNTSVESTSALRARLIGNIGFVFSFRVKHNSTVLPGIEDTDRFTSASLEYVF